MRILLLALCLLSFTISLASSESVTRRQEQLPPYREICSYTKDIFDNGNYIKSACFIERQVQYHDAIHFCMVNQMNLFIMDDEVVASHLRDAAQEKYPIMKGLFWVNGNRPTLSKHWRVLDIEGRHGGPLNPRIPFYSNHESGNCLGITTKYSGIYDVLPGNCSTESYFVCEHREISQEPPKLDPSKCLFVRDLRGIKSLCIVGKNYDYDQSRRICASIGMNLFMFDSPKVDEAFFEATEDIMLRYPGGYFWINGQRNPQMNYWSLYHSNRLEYGPLYEEFEWIKLNNLNGISYGNCLRLSGQFGPYQGLGIDCKAKNFPICEFNNKF